jgi:hypothetical protein
MDFSIPVSDRWNGVSQISRLKPLSPYTTMYRVFLFSFLLSFGRPSNTMFQLTRAVPIIGAAEDVIDWAFVSGQQEHGQDYCSPQPSRFRKDSIGR